MLSFLFRKENRLMELIFKYVETLGRCRESFAEAMQGCVLHEEICQDFEFYLKQTHKHESRADDLREEINDLMYGDTLIPDSRGDIVELLQELDKIPHVFEIVLHMIQTQKLRLPGFLLPDIKELIRISLECCDLVISQVSAFFKKDAGLRALSNTIDTNESHCDHMERKIITGLFESGLDPFQKILIRDLVAQIGRISDQADRVSKFINILSMKRRV